MTIEEKVGQMIQLSASEKKNLDVLEKWNIGSYLHCKGEQNNDLQKRAEHTRLGIPLIFGIDAIHGHCFENGATIFPTQLAMSCSWNTDVIRACGEVTAKEVKATGFHWTFSPVLCAGRDTRWGRIDETFGEDAWLCGEFALAMIEGYQGNGDFSSDDNILACGKHFVAYGETIGGRDAYDTFIPKRELFAHFLPPFEKIVKKGKVATLMAAYQAIDGVPCSASGWLLKDIPASWNMDGWIVTDWDNIRSLHLNQKVAENEKHAAYLGIKAGNNMIMTTFSFYLNTLELIQEGKVQKSEIDELISPILRDKFRLGLFDENRYKDFSQASTILGASEHWTQSLEASNESLVLLQNKNGILPLNKDDKKKILVTGPNADDFVAQLGDWSFGEGQSYMHDPNFQRKEFVSVLQGIQEEFGDTVVYNKGCDVIDTTNEDIEETTRMAQESDIVITVVGDTKSQHGEFYDRANLNLSGAQEDLLKALKKTGKPLIVILVSSKPLSIPWIKQHADALLVAFNPGSKGGVSIAKTLSGANNPSGKLTISFPHHVGQLPVYYNSYDGWHAGEHHLREGYHDIPADPTFVFGEGMSYTTFTYNNLKLTSTEISAGEMLKVSVDITNTGNKDGKEIIQVYYNDVYSSVTTPIKELCAYQKVNIAKGETKTVEFEIPFEEFSLVNEKLEEVVEEGEFELFVGASSKNEDLLKSKFIVRNTQVLRKLS